MGKPILNFIVFLILFSTPSMEQIPIVKKCEGKAIPLQTWTDPEISRRLRLPDFKTIGT